MPGRSLSTADRRSTSRAACLHSSASRCATVPRWSSSTTISSRISPCSRTSSRALARAGAAQGEAIDAARLLLDRVGLADKENARPHQLSGGQQQRVGIVRALALRPDLLLFDEPTSALDPELVGEVLLVIKELADEGWSMVVVTHELSFAREAADRVLFMDGGVVVEQGPPAQLFGAPQHERTQKFLTRILRPLDGT
nr:ATP-binding cassette domain-containing protein [Microbacterium suwonense]